MKILEKVLILIVLLGFLFVACTKESDNDSSDKIGNASDLLFLDPELQPGTFRNIDKIFNTRTIKRGETVYSLPYSASLLTSVKYSPDAVNTYDIDDFITRNDVAGLLIIKDGKIVLERYAKGNSADSRWVGFSTGKSVVSTLIGIAIQDGKIKSIDDQVTDYLPQLLSTAYEGVTIKQLLQMSSGLQWNEDYLDSTSDISAVCQLIVDGKAGSILDYMSKLPREAEPGTRFNYKTGETHIEAEVLNSVLGDESISDYLSRKIWANMGMEADANWVLESTNGIEFGGGLISMTLRDYGRFGTFILNNGVVNSEAILPTDWVEEATSVTSDAPQCGYGVLYSDYNVDDAPSTYPLGYGYNWWLLPPAWGVWDYLNDTSYWGSYAIDVTQPNLPNLVGTYTAMGIFGQFIHINKEQNIVSVVLSAWEIPWIDPKEYETYCFLDAVTALLKE